MSVIIVGGHDRMVRQYMDICKNYNCKSKVFTQMPGNFKSKIGGADLLVVFTGTVSHKMAVGAAQEARKNNICIAHCHSSGGCSLKKILEEYLPRKLETT